MCQGEYRDFVARLPELQRIVDESDTKVNYVGNLVESVRRRGKGVIVYFPLKAGLRKLAERIPDSLILTGDVSSIKEREKIRSQFDKGKILLMTSAGSRSYNFHAGNQVVFYTIPFEIEVFIQTVGRVARPMVSKYSEIDVYLPSA